MVDSPIPGLFLITQNSLMLYLAMAFIGGFMLALIFRYPALTLKKALLSLQGKRPQPLIMLTKDGVLYPSIAATKNTNPEKAEEALIREGEALNIMGLGRGYVYYENNIIPLDLSARALTHATNNYGEKIEEGLTTTDKEGKKHLGAMPGVGLRIISFSTISSFYTRHRLLAQKLAEEGANKKLGLLLIITIIVSTFTLVAVLYQLNMMNNVSKMFQEAYTLLQQGSFGVKP